MKYATKPQLQKSINGFLNQRRRACRMIKAPHMEQICLELKDTFGMIKRWNYWRHCLEVSENEILFLMILPSQTGGHATERRHMLELIAHCKQVAAIPAHIYNQSKAQVPERRPTHE